VELEGALVGRRLEGAGRRGKYLLVDLDDGAVLVVHLRMSGQLRFVAAPATAVPVERHTHVRVGFTDDSELRFVDQRTFGELFVAAELDAARVPVALAGLGPDPLVHGIDPERLALAAAGRRTSVKAFLLDQRVLAGVGNLYADEALFRARIRPDRPVGSLGPRRLGRLVGALASVLGEAVTARGSTLRDARYVDLMGEPGTFQAAHAVYGREGEPCLRCGRPIRRIQLAGRSSHLCPACQR
jgi:formamidopyrimidine-DNA glycosylase